MKIVFATGNAHKLQEAAEILSPGIELLSPSQVGINDDIEETGQTLEENSRLKAEAIYSRCGIACFADDTGLEVDCLGGEPGVMSARYAGVAHDDRANINKLLSALSGRTCDERKARFRTVITFIDQGEVKSFEGIVTGRISEQVSGKGGFGYDPVFIPDEIPSPDGSLIPNSEALSFADITEEAKNAVSHRGRAIRALAQYLL